MKNKASNVLIGYAKVAGLDREAFRRCSGLTPATFSRRMKNPDDITVGELRDMLRAIRIMPDEALIKFIREGTKWIVKYTVDNAAGGKTEHEEVINAGTLRDAAMKAHALIVRPRKQDPKIRSAEIWSLQQKEHAADAST